jgi:hypothetical protein
MTLPIVTEDVAMQIRLALKPFADACDDAIGDEDLDSQSAWDHPVGLNVNIRDFRKARDIYLKLGSLR